MCSTSDIRGITDFDGSKEGEGTGDRSKILGMSSIVKLKERDLREGDTIRELEMQEGSKIVEDQGEVIVILIKEGGENLIDSKEIRRDRGDWGRQETEQKISVRLSLLDYTNNVDHKTGWRGCIEKEY